MSERHRLLELIRDKVDQIQIYEGQTLGFSILTKGLSGVGDPHALSGHKFVHGPWYLQVIKIDVSHNQRTPDLRDVISVTVKNLGRASSLRIMEDSCAGE